MSVQEGKKKNDYCKKSIRKKPGQFVQAQKATIYHYPFLLLIHVVPLKIF